MNSSDSPAVGEIVLIDFPFTNFKGSKVRPGLVLGQGDREDDWIVAFVSSEVDAYLAAEFAVFLGKGDLATGSMRMDSVARVDKTAVVASRKMTRTGVARLTDAKLREALKKWNQVSVRSFSRAFHSAQRPGGDEARAAPSSRVNP